MSSNSKRVRSRIGLSNGARIAAAETLWAHPRLGELIPFILRRAYSVASASVSLMEAGVEECERRAGDPVADGFATYLRKHIPEEVGHDEECLDDLEVIGESRTDVKATIPYFPIVTMLGMQYYWMRHRHPIALAGYLAIIEGHPPSAQRVAKLRETSGLPAQAFRTLLWHADHDAEHTEELDALLNELPLTSEHVSLIGINIARTNDLLAKSVHDMLAQFEQRADIAVATAS